MSAEEAIAVVRRNTEEVQGQGNFEVFEELFAPDFVDHTPQPGRFFRRSKRRSCSLQDSTRGIPRLSCEDPLANLRWRPGHNI